MAVSWCGAACIEISLCTRSIEIQMKINWESRLYTMRSKGHSQSGARSIIPLSFNYLILAYCIRWWRRTTVHIKISVRKCGVKHLLMLRTALWSVKFNDILFSLYTGYILLWIYFELNEFFLYDIVNFI